MKRVYIALFMSILAGILEQFPTLVPEMNVPGFASIALQWLALGFVIPFLFSKAKRAMRLFIFVQIAVLPLAIFLLSSNPEAVLLTGAFTILPGLFVRFKEERPLALDKRVHFTWQDHVQMSR